jgi:aryl-alcohol dehydrogenase-like predicted oxidoreductase
MEIETKYYKIGIGTYRMNTESIQHIEALTYAIEKGCKLIDTASNYGKGKAEELIGKVMTEKTLINSKIKIISKAGYVDEEELNNFLECSYKINNSFHYNISPSFIEYKIKLSLKRLNTKKVYGYLLHNPEYLLSCMNEKEFYTLIKKSFIFLKGMVEKGYIEYYGISSNTITSKKEINIEKLVDISNEISKYNHFKILQFPFNLYEKDAEKKKYENDELNLFEYAKKNKLITFINRPFTGSVNSRPIPIVSYESEDFSDLISLNAYSEFKETLEKITKNKGIIIPIDSIEQFHFLKENWDKFKSEKLINLFVHQEIEPILKNYCLTRDDLQVNDLLINLILKISRVIKQKIHIHNQKIKTELCKKNKNYDINESYASILCKDYMKSGADCVLVGMRKTIYVDNVSDLFYV